MSQRLSRRISNALAYLLKELETPYGMVAEVDMCFCEAAQLKSRPYSVD